MNTCRKKLTSFLMIDIFFFVDRLWWDSIISCYFVWNALRNIDLFAHVFAVVVVAVAVALLPSFLPPTTANRIETKCGTNILNQKGTLTRKNPVALLDLIYAIFEGKAFSWPRITCSRGRKRVKESKVQPKHRWQRMKKKIHQKHAGSEKQMSAHFTSSWIHPQHQTGIE